MLLSSDSEEEVLGALPQKGSLANIFSYSDGRPSGWKLGKLMDGFNTLACPMCKDDVLIRGDLDLFVHLKSHSTRSRKQEMVDRQCELCVAEGTFHSLTANLVPYHMQINHGNHVVFMKTITLSRLNSIAADGNQETITEEPTSQGWVPPPIVAEETAAKPHRTYTSKFWTFKGNMVICPLCIFGDTLVGAKFKNMAKHIQKVHCGPLETFHIKNLGIVLDCKYCGHHNVSITNLEAHKDCESLQTSRRIAENERLASRSRTHLGCDDVQSVSLPTTSELQPSCLNLAQTAPYQEAVVTSSILQPNTAPASILEGLPTNQASTSLIINPFFTEDVDTSNKSKAMTLLSPTQKQVESALNSNSKPVSSPAILQNETTSHSVSKVNVDELFKLNTNNHPKPESKTKTGPAEPVMLTSLQLSYPEILMDQLTPGTAEKRKTDDADNEPALKNTKIPKLANPSSNYQPLNDPERVVAQVQRPIGFVDSPPSGWPGLQLPFAPPSWHHLPAPPWYRGPPPPWMIQRPPIHPQPGHVINWGLHPRIPSYMGWPPRAPHWRS